MNVVPAVCACAVMVLLGCAPKTLMRGGATPGEALAQGLVALSEPIVIEGDHAGVVLDSALSAKRGRPIARAVTVGYDAKRLDKSLPHNRSTVGVYLVEGDKLIRVGDTHVDSVKREVTFRSLLAGTYVVLGRTAPPGVSIVAPRTVGDFERALLLVAGPLTARRTWGPLIEKLAVARPELVVMQFTYAPDRHPDSVAALLADELRRLHREHGGFRLDVYTHGLGAVPVMAYVADSAGYLGDIDRFLSVAPPTDGSRLVEREVMADLVATATTQRGAVPAVRRALLPATILGESGLLYAYRSEYLDSLKSRYRRMARPGSSEDRRQKVVRAECIRGNGVGEAGEEFADGPDELVPGRGDGFTRTDIALFDAGMSVLPMAPLPLAHFEITGDSAVVAALTTYVGLPFSGDPFEKPQVSWDDMHRFGAEDVALHAWRGIATEVLTAMGRDMLASVDSNAILFANGDFDTFYPWQVQATENFRTDVTVVNLSLLNLKSFIRLLRRSGVPMTFSEADIDAIDHEYLDASDIDSMVAGIRVRLPRFFRIQDKMVLSILAACDWQRPVYFGVTVSKDNQAGLGAYLSQEGLVYRVTRLNNPPFDRARNRYLLDSVYQTPPSEVACEYAGSVIANYIATAARLTLEARTAVMKLKRRAEEVGAGIDGLSPEQPAYRSARAELDSIAHEIDLRQQEVSSLLVRHLDWMLRNKIAGRLVLSLAGVMPLDEAVDKVADRYLRGPEPDRAIQMEYLSYLMQMEETAPGKARLGDEIASATKRFPRDPDLLFLVGAYYYQTDQLTQALPWLERAREVSRGGDARIDVLLRRVLEALEASSR